MRCASGPSRIRRRRAGAGRERQHVPAARVGLVSGDSAAAAELERGVVLAVAAAEVRAPGAEAMARRAAGWCVVERAHERRLGLGRELHAAALRRAGCRGVGEARARLLQARHAEEALRLRLEHLGTERARERDRVGLEPRRPRLAERVAGEVACGVGERGGAARSRMADRVRSQHGGGACRELIRERERHRHPGPCAR